MVPTLLQLETLQKIILNTLTVSIPEELFLVMFTLILMGEFDYWKEGECKKLINRWDYGRILIPTIIVALLSNTLRYTGVDLGITSIIQALALYILIVVTNDIFGDATALKWMGKAFVFLFIGLIILMVSELVYIPFIIYGTGKSVEQINSNIGLNFLISIPSRLFQYSILLYFVARKRTLLKGNIIKQVTESKILSVIAFIVVLFDLVFIYSACKAIGYDKILLNLSHVQQIFIIVACILVPIINISGLIWSVYYLENRATQKQKQAFEKLGTLLGEIRLYTNNENYDNISWKLNEIGMGIEEIAESLYKVNETANNRK